MKITCIKCGKNVSGIKGLQNHLKVRHTAFCGNRRSPQNMNHYTTCINVTKIKKSLCAHPKWQKDYTLTTVVLFEDSLSDLSEKNRGICRSCYHFIMKITCIKCGKNVSGIKGLQNHLKVRHTALCGNRRSPQNMNHYTTFPYFREKKKSKYFNHIKIWIRSCCMSTVFRGTDQSLRSQRTCRVS